MSASKLQGLASLVVGWAGISRVRLPGARDSLSLKAAGSQLTGQTPSWNTGLSSSEST